jgi:hypothetical protein
VLEILGGGDQARDFLAAQYHRQGTRHAHQQHPGHQLGLVGRDGEEELQCCDSRIERDGRSAAVDQVQLIAA